MCENCNSQKETPIRVPPHKGAASTVNAVVSLPLYESNATPEQREETQALMAKQLRLIMDQHENGTPARFVKVRCGCLKMVRIYSHAYRCLYCGIWFCKECAQLHFGYRVPEPYAEIKPAG